MIRLSSLSLSLVFLTLYLISDGDDELEGLESWWTKIQVSNMNPQTDFHISNIEAMTMLIWQVLRTRCEHWIRSELHFRLSRVSSSNQRGWTLERQRHAPMRLFSTCSNRRGPQAWDGHHQHQARLKKARFVIEGSKAKHKLFCA